MMPQAQSLIRKFVKPTGSTERRALIVTGIAHALHDGYTDMIYILLPVWQAEFALSYSALALLRGLYAGAMAGLQILAGSAAKRLSGRIVLAIGTALAACGYILAGFSGSLPGLCIALLVGGIGSSTQHPIGSAVVARAYGGKARGPLGVYNFSGDLGKAALPAATSLLIAYMQWRAALWVIAASGILVAILVALFMPNVSDREVAAEKPTVPVTPAKKGGFELLFAIGVLDTAVRMGLLTFLPFLLKQKGASLTTVGVALALVFMGGAVGKFVCGWLGSRLGVLGTVLLTEGATAGLILLFLELPLAPGVAILPILGVMLNGTSSVLYGTVPEFTTPERAERAFAIFYTGTIGAGAIAPVLYGMLGDSIGASWATVATAATAFATLPLAMALSPRLPV